MVENICVILTLKQTTLKEKDPYEKHFKMFCHRVLTEQHSVYQCDITQLNTC